VAGLLTGHRVLLLDLHGHGRSSKPTDPARYAWAELAADITGLLDALEIDQAVVGGLSLGANATLAFARDHPARCRALVFEMPVLMRGHRFGRPAFTGMAGVYTGGRRVLRPLARAVNRLPLPKNLPELAALRDMAGQDPSVAAAVIHGLLAEPPLPDDRQALATLTMPALVIGHARDPLHVLDDARDLAANLPNARLVETSSSAHYRLHPGELATELQAFLDQLPPQLPPPSP
jgi:pimeloyl-ACP methyl ester carboxylesterase